jgi:hypothetical protein
MRPVESRASWKSSARLSEGREIVYYGETPGTGRAAVPEDRSRFAAHLQVLSVQRAPGTLKYLAGTESGMGVWIMDAEPEAAARTLREVM